MVEKLDETGMHIVNRNIEGDMEGKWTYLGGNGCSTIDYVITNEEG
ncbi:hypothetical protein TSAR_007686 [Trichomalopsis sarcophagae]|uniref:Uncharacterized protein n=1 Tax=Trichomalopsis sarcophagae TaxID=543379 RepID=A0A232EI05_9HYME|nr:hypothetical protein TSAR_007686 [Trichomalopsis sarcophagae]